MRATQVCLLEIPGWAGMMRRGAGGDPGFPVHRAAPYRATAAHLRIATARYPHIARLGLIPALPALCMGTSFRAAGYMKVIRIVDQARAAPCCIPREPPEARHPLRIDAAPALPELFRLRLGTQ